LEKLTVNENLRRAAELFALPPPSGPGSATPDLDARVLWEHVFGWSRTRLILEADRVVEPPDSWQKAVLRRCSGEPVAYVTGHKEFWGLDFAVGPGVLVPRPDTETLVEAALESWKAENPHEGKKLYRVLDVCTGSGCVGVALASVFQKEGREGLWSVEASDLSVVAVETARTNSERLVGGRVEVYQADLTLGLSGPWDLIVSNPPYLTSEETAERLGPGGWKEPGLALDGGPEGLDLLRRLVEEAQEKLSPGGWLWIEAAPGQMNELCRIFSSSGLESLRVRCDLSGLKRVLGGQKPVGRTPFNG
jgi:release factor glutamine methyltransferase